VAGPLAPCAGGSAAGMGAGTPVAQLADGFEAPAHGWRPGAATRRSDPVTWPAILTPRGSRADPKQPLTLLT